MTTLFRILLLGLFLLPGTTRAQGLFSTVATVNDSAVSNYELQQRITMLKLFRTPGDLRSVALEQLIDDRLKGAAVRQAALKVEPEVLQAEMANFAARADMDLDQFLSLLSAAGVDRETFRDFVQSGITWRDYIRISYGNRVAITDEEIDRAIQKAGGPRNQLEVLLSEIIIPAPPPRAAEAAAIAQSISQMRSTAAFSNAARKYSALPSRDNGGRLDWLPLANYPAPLHRLILDLENGEVTQPINIPNGIALFQMRGVREGAAIPRAIAEIDYATFAIPSVDTQAGREAYTQILANADHCDDLYGLAQGNFKNLNRATQTPADIPRDIGIALSSLDPDEIATGVTRDGGATTLLVMLCSRTPEFDAPLDREAIANQLRSQRLAGYADAHLANLRDAAIITYQ